jgi:hypothetical protein
MSVPEKEVQVALLPGGMSFELRLPVLPSILSSYGRAYVLMNIEMARTVRSLFINHTLDQVSCVHA